MGFSECGIGKAFHEKKNRTDEYELEWLETPSKPEAKDDIKIDDSVIAKRIEGLVNAYTHPVCIYCGKPMTHKERVKNGFGVYDVDEKTGHIKTFNETKTIYDANKLTGISTRALRNAADQGNPMITR